MPSLRHEIHPVDVSDQWVSIRNLSEEKRGKDELQTKRALETLDEDDYEVTAVSFLADCKLNGLSFHAAWSQLMEWTSPPKSWTRTLPDPEIPTILEFFKTAALEAYAAR